MPSSDMSDKPTLSIIKCYYLMHVNCLSSSEFQLFFLISSRRLEVSRVELLLQVGTFCMAVGALVAGISFTRYNLELNCIGFLWEY